MRNFFAGALFAATMTLGATTADAAPVTLQATISGITGSAALLNELGISDGTARAMLTFDSDLSSGAASSSNPNYKYDQLRSAYSGFSLVAPNVTVDAVPPGGANHTVYSRDAAPDSPNSLADIFMVLSDLGSTDPGSYSLLRIRAVDGDANTWSRSDPISADLLNSFSSDSFVFQKYIGNSFTSIVSTNITWAEVSYAPLAAVPLPAGLPLLIAGLGVFGVMRRRQRS